jgi:hypothetical protein
MHNWQKIYSTERPFRAELVKSLLEEREYQPVLVNKKDTSYLFGNYEIYVAPKYVLKAIKIITDELRFK